MVELLVAMGITAVLMVGILRTLSNVSRAFSIIENTSRMQQRVSTFSQNLEILLFNAYEGEFRQFGDNTEAALFDLSSDPVPDNDTIFFRLGDDSANPRITNWAKLVYFNNNLYWVNQISSSDTTFASQGSENWQEIMTNIDRETEGETIFRLIYKNPKDTSSEVKGVQIRCHIQLPVTSTQPAVSSFLFETSIKFANAS